MAELIKPQTVTIKDRDGIEHPFVISRLPATVGREILAKYPVANVPKLGDYGTSTEAMLLMMKYVGIERDDGSVLKLSTQALIDNHVPDGEALIRLELEMLKYNTSFFGLAGNSDFVGSLLQKYLPLVIKTLMDSLPPSLVQGLQAGQNSKQA